MFVAKKLVLKSDKTSSIKLTTNDKDVLFKYIYDNRATDEGVTTFPAD
jgi:hypothetical protein